MATDSPTSIINPRRQSVRDHDLWSLFGGAPFAKYQYVDVTFPSTADADTVVEHALRPIDPTSLRYIPVSKSAAGDVYHDHAVDARPWGEGYIILRCSAASATVRLLLIQER